MWRRPNKRVIQLVIITIIIILLSLLFTDTDSVNKTQYGGFSLRIFVFQLLENSDIIDNNSTLVLFYCNITIFNFTLHLNEIECFGSFHSMCNNTSPGNYEYTIALGCTLSFLSWSPLRTCQMFINYWSMHVYNTNLSVDLPEEQCYYRNLWQLI